MSSSSSSLSNQESKREVITLSDDDDEEKLKDERTPELVSSNKKRPNYNRSHSKGQAGKYLREMAPRVNRGGASDMSWVNLMIDNRDKDFFERLRANLASLQASCTVKDPDNIGCILTDRILSDHRRTSTEAFRQMIERHGPEFKLIPMRISVHVLAIVIAGKRLPEGICPAHPTSKRKKGAFWTASHLCHNKSCSNPDHLVWEPNWFNRQRDGCLGLPYCSHGPDFCLRPHRRQSQNVNWRDLAVPEDEEVVDD